LTKNGLGYIHLGDFFTNSSGHTEFAKTKETTHQVDWQSLEQQAEQG
jgi:hypothetical protein